MNYETVDLKQLEELLTRIMDDKMRNSINTDRSIAGMLVERINKNGELNEN